MAGRRGDAGENGATPAIDLSWQPDTEADLAGYIVYRREPRLARWQRISPAQPVIGPGYHDANVKPGRTYEYAVSAIDQRGTKARDRRRRGDGSRSVDILLQGGCSMKYCRFSLAGRPSTVRVEEHIGAFAHH